MKSRCRNPSSISLNARVSCPISSLERTGSDCERSPAATRATPPVSALIGLVTRRARSTPTISAPSAPANEAPITVLRSSARRRRETSTE